MPNVSFYGSHNAALVIEDKGQILEIIELERLFNSKNMGLAQYKTPRGEFILPVTEWLSKYIQEKFNTDQFDNCIYMNTDVAIYERHELSRLIPAKNYIYGHHHESHAAGGFYQSPYQKALIFSFDGGGDDGKFNIYTCERGESPVCLARISNPKIGLEYVYYDLGFPYMTFGMYLNDIKYADLGTGNLVYPGKLMGLASYSKPVEEWIPAFTEYYKSNPSGTDYLEKIAALGASIGVTFDTNDRLRGDISKKIAATSQKVFEECFLEIAKPYLEKYPDLPVCMVGGCALNIILNTRIKTEFKRDVFVGPNPNDCGVATGLMLNFIKPAVAPDLTYKGVGLLDLVMLPDYIQNLDTHLEISTPDITRVAEDIASGKIIGVARGRAEHGPRALGNRSILCNPTILEMKDILNDKVKHREWYRPFAPVVRLEDVSTYFEWEGESRWMSFCPTVRAEWRDKLPAITHVDNTARVQTVTREQNEWLYDLLTVFKEKTGVGVLLNTSFNVDGKPILSTVRDACNILYKTELDGVVIENLYLTKWKT
jgi:carbamoyltransferase